jgi:hypothetical protein
MQLEGMTLAAAFAAAVVEAGPALPGHTDWTGIVTTTDVQADCVPPVAASAVGEYVASISLLLGPDDRSADPFENARALSAQLKANRPAALKMDQDVPPTQTKGAADSFAAAADRFPSGICLSDIGDLDRLSGRSVGISDILLMPNQNHGAHPIMVAVISTHDGLSLSFGYDEPLRTRPNAVAFADRYVEALRTWAKAPPT